MQETQLNSKLFRQKFVTETLLVKYLIIYLANAKMFTV